MRVVFWYRKQHEVKLLYEPGFSEKIFSTKARPIQMNKDLLSYCKKEIHDFFDKKLTRKSKSPWSCSAFFVQKQVELEKGTPRLVINYKPLNIYNQVARGRKVKKEKKIKRKKEGRIEQGRP